MLELLHLSPEWILTFIGVLGDLKAIAFAVVCLGAFLMIPMFSMSRNTPLTVCFIGLILMASGGATALYTNYEIGCLRNERVYTSVPSYIYTTSDYQPIMSLQDGQSYSMSGGGSFFLGIGSVSINGQTTPQYVFYKKLTDGYQLGTIPAGDIIIKEDADMNTSKIEWLYTHSVSEKKIYSDNGEIVGGTESVSLTSKYIHVPKGTVKINYNLDSKLWGA
jgi:hypothetical protein